MSDLKANTSAEVRVSWTDRALLWAARITGGVMVALLGFVIVVNAVGTTRDALPRGWEWFALAMFPLGVFVGYALAFWRPMVGGITALMCLAAWLIYVRFAANLPLIAAVIAVPGVLYLVHAVKTRRKESMS
jgi:hypothetical protein